jgi:hypothetical protein
MAFPMPTGEGETGVGDNAAPVSHSLAPAADGAPRGLRLAPASTASDEGTPEAPAEDDDTAPPETPPPAPSTPRPALKRIK